MSSNDIYLIIIMIIIIIFIRRIIAMSRLSYSPTIILCQYHMAIDVYSDKRSLTVGDDMYRDLADWPLTHVSTCECMHYYIHISCAQKEIGETNEGIYMNVRLRDRPCDADVRATTRARSSDDDDATLIRDNFMGHVNVSSIYFSQGCPLFVVHYIAYVRE